MYYVRIVYGIPVRIAPNTEIFKQDQVKRNLFDIQMAPALYTE